MKEFRHLQDFEDHALKILPKDASNFYNYAAGKGHSMKLNEKAYRR